MRPFGVYPVLYAFWTADGGLDAALMRQQVEHCIAQGAHGVMVLGLVTEVHKMDTAERLALVRLVGGLIAGRVPYAVTVGEPTVEGQVAFIQAARAAGADWVILQPPPGPVTETELIRFFGTVAEGVAGLVDGIAIQNNPVNLSVSLSVPGLIALARAHPAITILKAEGSAVDIARVIAEAGHYTVFGGQGGREFPALMRAGGAGLIPAPDCLAVQVRMFNLFQDGSLAALAEAERLHHQVLPMIVFLTTDIPTLLAYGKRLFALGLGAPEPIDRAPAAAVTAFGLAEVARFRAALDALDA